MGMMNHVEPIARAESQSYERMAAALSEARRLSGQIVAQGRLMRASASVSLDVENPATATTIGTVPRCGHDDVDEVVRGAHSAWPAWSRRPARERGALLFSVADHLEKHAEELARLSAFETGNALATQTRGEAVTMVDILRFFAGLAGELKGQTVPAAPGVFQYSKRESMGVVGAIIPWNAPLMQTASKIAPALTAGNTVVLKPAEQAPLAVLRAFELIQEVLPPGVANCVTGVGEEAGRFLVGHPLVRKITFTGSTAVGAEILRGAAAKIVPVTAELGGKNQSSSWPTPIQAAPRKAFCEACVSNARDNRAARERASTFTKISMPGLWSSSCKRSQASSSAIPSTMRRRWAQSSRATSLRASSDMSRS